ncbi:TPA: hypothetical protein QCD44_000582 [Enterobacter hormaechei]|uniref:hypothetical protein n=1 Tax=Enterobacter hormaechei TaxID=158836 RepID=UPI00285BBABA|nr:hypothetical protein [Enterobacter hormaechei]ELD3466720.1 hypothetical protein [Enterobacter hormaechei]MED5730038.1 hypothetical protein [Enterobacter hormaechei]HBM2511279.1 hypothetical protein [Enterobacter hormaechei]HBM2519096.1 hypothetical protein [Enterobacter hormaechei]HBM2528172.1 hypothetical protein [Enterobacter hormaechei]
MEMRITALIVVIGLLLTALHGGWNISDITVLFVVNLGNSLLAARKSGLLNPQRFLPHRI